MLSPNQILISDNNILYMIPTIITQGIYSGFIGTVSTVTIKACTTISSLSYYDNPDVKKILIELDIEYRLSIIKSVLYKFDVSSSRKLWQQPLNDLEKTQIFTMITDNNDLDKDPVRLSLAHLYATIKNIDYILKQIDLKIARHNSKWFSYWRYLNIDSLLIDLKTNSVQLETRFNNFLTISEFINKLER